MNTLRRILSGVAMTLVTCSIVAAQTVKVEIEFAVDMSVEIATGNFDPETQLVVVAGSFNGWTTAADTLVPDFITPSLYTKLVQIDTVTVNTTFEYKYVTGTAGSAPDGWESVDNRTITITGNEPDEDNNGYLDVVQASIPTYNNNKIEDFFRSDMTITFEVDARPAYYFLADSGFVPSDVQTNETVSTWSGVYANGLLSTSRGWDTWGPDVLGSDPTQMLHDDGTNGDAVAGDSVFTIVISYTSGEPRKGVIKFGLDGYDNESLFGANHQLILPDDAAGKTAGEATVSLIFGAMENADGSYQDALFDAYIRKLRSGGAAVTRSGGATDPTEVNVVKAEIEFAVDMTVEIATGNFDPETQLVVVAGSFNGWTTAADTLVPDFITPSLYTKLVQIDSVQIDTASTSKTSSFTYEYKYVTGTAGSAPDGWESVDNRTITITGDEPDADNNGYLDVVQATVPTYNNNKLEDFFAEAMTITFVVDARPAYYFLADSGFVPSDVQTNETVSTWSGIYANGLLSTSRGWDTWGPDVLGSDPTQMLHDDGTNGDAVAGDSLFTIVISYEAAEPRKGVIKFGLDGYDNESLFGANHQLVLPDAGQAGKTAGEATVNLIFGAMETGTGTFQDALYDEYILLAPSAEGVVSAVVRRGGTEAENVAVEPIAGEIPEKIVLGENYPNPFNPSTTFEYSISDPMHVKVLVYDMTGRLVEKLVDELQSPSSYRVTFDAGNLSSGVYIYQLVTPERVISKKMLLVK